MQAHTEESVSDIAVPDFRLVLDHSPSWDFVQLATVNDKSILTLPPDSGDPDDPPQKFDGWYVTLDRNGLRDLIDRAKSALERMA